jgi:large subunit ribosomal protein L21
LYAIIQDRTRQTTVRTGDVILCDLNKSCTAGEKITFSDILTAGHEGEVKLGKPLIQGASVVGEVVGTVKGEKVVAFRFKRRKGVRRKRGHRQSYTQVRITGIEVPGWKS